MESHNRDVAQALSVCRLNVRPQVEVPDSVHPRFAGNLEDARVVISPDGLADVDWDVTPEPQAWILHLSGADLLQRREVGISDRLRVDRRRRPVVVSRLPGQGPAGRLEFCRRHPPSRSRLRKKSAGTRQTRRLNRAERSRRALHAGADQLIPEALDGRVLVAMPEPLPVARHRLPAALQGGVVVGARAGDEGRACAHLLPGAGHGGPVSHVAPTTAFTPLRPSSPIPASSPGTRPSRAPSW